MSMSCTRGRNHWWAQGSRASPRLTAIRARNQRTLMWVSCCFRRSNMRPRHFGGCSSFHYKRKEGVCERDRRHSVQRRNTRNIQTRGDDRAPAHMKKIHRPHSPNEIGDRSLPFTVEVNEPAPGSVAEAPAGCPEQSARPTDHRN